MKKIWCLLCFVQLLCSETAWVRNNAAPILGRHTVKHLQSSGLRAEAEEAVGQKRFRTLAEAKKAAIASLREHIRKTEQEAAAAEAAAVAATNREAAEAAAVEAATAAENAAAQAVYRKLQQKNEELQQKKEENKFHDMLASSMNFESRYLQLFLGAIIPSVALLMLSNYIIASKGDSTLGAVSKTLIGDLTTRPWNVYLDEYGDVEADILSSMQMQERLNDEVELTEEDMQKSSQETGDESLLGSIQEPEELDWVKVAVKVVVFVALFLVLMAWLEHFCDKEVTAASEQLMRFLGLPGLFLAVLLADSLPQPFTYVPLIFMAVKGNVDKPIVFTVCAVASYSAAWVGYVVGWNVRSFQWAQALMKRLTLAYPMVPQLMERKGAWGVASAAFLPVPLAVATWTAGSFRIRLFPFALAALMRLPKIAVFVLLSRRN